MRVPANGQVTIPWDICESAGLMPGSEIEFVVENETLVIRKATVERRLTRGQRMVERLRGAGEYGMGASEVVDLMRGPPADAAA